jgi:DNA-binding NtrC family response regulator
LRTRPAIPVIVITGHDSLSARSESVALGVSDYLAKPIDVDVLIASILKSLEAGAPPLSN